MHVLESEQRPKELQLFFCGEKQLELQNSRVEKMKVIPQNWNMHDTLNIMQNISTLLIETMAIRAKCLFFK